MSYRMSSNDPEQDGTIDPLYLLAVDKEEKFFFI